ncbi:MAG: universal stress protein [Anaerolineales bacterium]|nr:universal stress protein [Anaerolineales bacterium]MCB8954484.1 universal stress protein [Ardenticatenales bacterium]
MFKHILVPLDGSALAESALPVALEVAQKFDGEITLVRVVLPPHVVSHTTGAAYASLITGLRELAYEEAESYLKTQQGSLRQQGHIVHCKVVDGEPVADIILDVAEGLPVDLIVMSTHGRSGVSRWVFGSVADRVLRLASMPILLVRAQPGTAA